MLGVSLKRIPRRLFTEEFKREASKLVAEQHLNVAVASRQLNVAPKSIRSWIADSERGELKATLGAAKLTADQQRIRELERELTIAREERDILEKPLSIQSELAAQGVVAGINRIKRLRTLHGIRCTHQRKLRVTTDSKHLLPVARNVLDRQFTCTSPNQEWVADITYIPTGEGWLYLAAIKELYTCEIVGWWMDNRMAQMLVMDALTAAYWKKKPAPGLMHRSDRGSQYCSATCGGLQTSYGMQTSMSRNGNCWDNAPMESFFGTIKTESLHHYRFKTREHAKRVIFEYIEVFYNRIRRHAKIGNTTPANFASQHYICNQIAA